MDFLWSPWRGNYVASAQKPAGCIFCYLATARVSPGDDTDFDEEHFVLHRGRHNFIVLNLYPYTTAHLMVVPFAHSGDFSQADKVATDEMMDLAKVAQKVIALEYHPQGYNLGMNLGDAAGAGVAAHFHLHVLPRWAGDANFMTTVGETRVLPESLNRTYSRLKAHFQ